MSHRLVVAEDVATLLGAAGGLTADLFDHACGSELQARDIPGTHPRTHQLGPMRCTRPREHGWLHAAGTTSTSAAALWTDDGRAWHTRMLVLFDDPDAKLCLAELEAAPQTFVACIRDLGHPPDFHMAVDHHYRAVAAWTD